MLEVVDPQNNHQEEKIPKADFSRFKMIPKRLLISGLIVIVLFLLIIFIQKPQIYIQHAATGNQTSDSCSPVPFYCLILGGQKTCTLPAVCPTLPPPTGFLAQKAPPPPKSATNGTPVKQPICTDNGNWSGYLYRFKAAQASLATSWNVSTITCSGKLIGISQWPGIDAGDKAIAQLGTASGCNTGKPVYYAWTENFPQPPLGLSSSIYPAKPGDKFSATVRETSLGNFIDTLTNQTRKWSFTTTMKFSAANARLKLQREIITENEGYGVNPVVTGLAKFTQVNFFNNEISENNGTAEPFDMAQGLYCINLNATGKIKQDNSSNMTNTNFNITWVHQ